MASPMELVPSFKGYSLLPYEIRRAIIEESVNGHCPRRAEYATVNKEWQSVVEKRTFNSLSLCASDTDQATDFDNLEQICVADRIDLVLEIRLLIVLNNPQIILDNSDPWRDENNEEDEDDDLFSHRCRVATSAFGRLFKVLQGWSRTKEPLYLTYELKCQGPKKGHMFLGEHLIIDSAGFPEVACIGSLRVPEFKWGIEPESAFQLLKKLPNAKEATITCSMDDDFGTPDVLQEWRSSPNFQGSILKVLSLESTAMWVRFSDFRWRDHPSLETSQSIFAMTSRLEELHLYHVVDVPHFLRAASRASGNTSDPAWPNMRTLSVTGSSTVSPSDEPLFNSELCDSITKALPHMLNISRFEVVIASPYYNDEGRCYWDNAYLQITVSGEDDRSVVRTGELLVYGITPSEYTEAEWKRIARSQWRCKLDGVPKKADSEKIQEENVQEQPAD